jgi:hypothetical protein
MSNGSPKRVFVSRIDEEKKIGAVLKDYVEDAFSNRVKVFSSDDPRDLPGGQRWLDVIEKELKAVDMLIAVLSPASVQRPWILMEFGGVWIRGIKILPFCHSGLKRNSLPRPLGDFQGCEIEEANVGTLILDAVASATEESFPRKYNTTEMRSELMSAVSGAPKLSHVPVTRPANMVDVSDEELTILKLLVMVKDSRDDEYANVAVIATNVGMKKSICEMHLTALEEKKLVTYIVNMNDGVSYAITEKGVRLLLNLGLLK